MPDIVNNKNIIKANIINGNNKIKANIVENKNDIKANVMSFRQATTEKAGIIRIATQEEVLLGVDNLTAITPLTLKTLGSQKYGVSLAMSFDPDTYILTISLINANGSILDTKTITLPNDNAIVDCEYQDENKTLIFTLQNGENITISLDNLQEQITNENQLSSDLVNDNNKNHKFVTTSQKDLLDNITSTANEINELHNGTATQTDFIKLHNITVSATELNYVDGVTSNIQNQLNDKLELNSISIDSNSTNYLSYDNTNGKISAKVSTNIVNNDTNLVTGSAVYDNTVSSVIAHLTDENKIVVTKGGNDTTITIDNVEHATKATNDEDNNNIKATYATKNEIQNDITLIDLSIDNNSTNYLNYDNTNGKFSANVDTIVGAISTNLITSGATQAALNNKQDKTTAVTHSENTSVGSTIQPIYIANDGLATVCNYTIEKSVPSNAVFTDTTYSNLSEFTDDLGANPIHTHSQYLTEHQDISGKADKATTLSGYGITDAYTKDEIDGKLLSGLVPNTRKINNKALSADITLSASDVNALPNSTIIPTISDIYDSTSSDGMSGKAVASALNDLSINVVSDTNGDLIIDI